MARLRYNGLTTTLGASLTSGATSVTFAAALAHSGGTPVPTITGSDYIPLTILTSGGAVSEIVYLTAYTSGATTGTITRAQEGTTGVAHSSGDKVIHGPTAADFAGGGATDVGVLAYKQHNPATMVTYATTSTTDADLDATNLSVTFTVPASGAVVVRLSALTISSAVVHMWSLREGGTTVPGTVSQVINNHNALQRTPYEIVITGLTPGSAHTYKWGWHVSTDAATMYVGGTSEATPAGPAVMIVTALP